MAITFENGYQYIPGILSPQNNWGVGFGADGTMKIGNNPFAASAIEVTPSGVLYRAFNKQPAVTAAVKILDLVTIPANAFTAATRALRITLWGAHAGNGNTVTSNVYAGGSGAVGDTNTDGTILFTSIVNSGSGTSTYAQATIMRTGVSTQTAIGLAGSAATPLANLVTALSLTETSAFILKLTQNCATAGTDLPLNWMVELLF